MLLTGTASFQAFCFVQVAQCKTPKHAPDPESARAGGEAEMV